MRAVRKDVPTREDRHVDFIGADLLSITLVGIVFGLAQSQDWGWASVGVIAPLAGRWYDRVGGRIPLVTGFGLMAISGVALGLSVWQNSYHGILPGLIAYGIGLALVLTVNDPVSLDTVPRAVHGQASGVSATAEQFGGALGIALLYLVFRASYLNRLYDIVTNGPMKDLTPALSSQLKKLLIGAESTGLHPGSVGPELAKYLVPAREASDFGYMTAFFTVTVLSLIALFIVARLVRKPGDVSDDDVADEADAPVGG